MRNPGFRLAAATTFLLAGVGSALAFEIPDGQSCGGLVCDLGLFGHKTEPGRDGPAVQTPSAAMLPQASAAAATKMQMKKPTGSHPTHLAKPRAEKPHVVTVAKTIGAPVKAATRTDIVPAAGMAAAIARPTPFAAPQTGPVVLVNPYVYTKPQPIQFQSVDPTVGM